MKVRNINLFTWSKACAFFFVLLILNSCQQRYAHIPKVKVKPVQVEQKAESPIQTPPRQAVLELPELSTKINPIQPEPISIPQETRSEEKTRSVADYRQNHSIVDTIYYELETNPEQGMSPRVDWNELHQSDRLSILAIIVLALVLAIVFTYFTFYLFSVAIFSSISWSIAGFIELIAILFAIFTLFTSILTVILIRVFLGKWLNLLDLLLSTLLVLIVVLVLAYLLQQYLIYFLLIISILAIVKLFQGSKLRAGIGSTKTREPKLKSD